MARGKRTWGDRGLLAAGVLMCASSLAHAFGGWPPLARELSDQGVPGELAGGMAVGWLFGSGAMAVCGVLVLLARRELRRGVAAGATTCAVVGTFYVIFGLAATAYRFPHLHFLTFIGLGLLVLLSARMAAAR